MEQARTYADLMDHVRALTERHITQLTGTDLHFSPVAHGITLNSPFWTVAHLAVTENWLILRGTDGPYQKFGWAKLFNMGTKPPSPEQCPPWEEVLAVFRDVHARSMAHVAALQDDQLKAPHRALMQLDGGDDIHAVIRHHLRHEAGHAGQLAWSCKIQGLPTI